MSQPLEYWQAENMSINLLEPTGIVAVDEIMRGVIGLVEHCFPGRVRGYYLEGGYANASAVVTSDIDLRIVFKGDVTPEETQRCNTIIEYCRLISPCMLDVAVESEDALLRVGAVRLKLGTRMLYGEDIRAAVPLKPLDQYLRDTMHAQFRLSARVRGNPATVTFPLDYPDSSDEFYGYARRRMRAIDWTAVPGTKDLVATTTLIATALIGLMTGQYVVSKRESVEQYHAQIGDEWTTFVQDVYEQCRMTWSYLVPEGSAERAQLRELCRQSLGFENHFFEHYRAYLLRELQHADARFARFAARRLGQLLYRDDEVITALQHASIHGGAELAAQATATLAQYEGQ